MSETQTISWFPGHMTKAKRKIESSLKLVDAVAEITDARIPISSRNPDLDKIIERKPRIILLNKCDLADVNETRKWVEFYKTNGILALPIDSKMGKGLKNFIPCVKKLLNDKIENLKQKGILSNGFKIMVVGIPNVGKSSFINAMSHNAKAKVANIPGVTKSNQWFNIGKNFELLDTPGVLWPKFEDPLVGEHLAFVGSIKHQILDVENLAIRLLELLVKEYPDLLIKRYNLYDIDISNMSGNDIINIIGKKRGMLIPGGDIDIERASIMLLDEFRNAKLGNITLEKV